MSPAQRYIGLMSGTSLDGVDAVLVDFSGNVPRQLAESHRPFDAALRNALLELNTPGPDELDRASVLGNELARCYAASVGDVLAQAALDSAAVRAIGCHGQTVRHRPERGYSIQIGNAALLAELAGISVVTDFRSRDVAAGGQGAPLVPAFHATVFGNPAEDRAVLNLGGIANLTLLRRAGAILGFDVGPGNCLLDLWAARHLGQRFDEGGRWAREGKVDSALLARLLGEPYFAAPPPKSTGRELFNEAWLRPRLTPTIDARDVQATLLELSARSVAQACARHCQGIARLIVCGGGSRNNLLLERLSALVSPIALESSDRHGIDPVLVEAYAFAWLAKQAIETQPAGLPAVTGARGARVLGAIYPR